MGRPLMCLSSTHKDVAEPMLRLGLYRSESRGDRVFENGAPSRLGAGEIAAEVEHVALANTAEQKRA